MLPSVTIGIATHNKRIETLRAVDSVLAQDYAGHIDVMVYHDGPTAAALIPNRPLAENRSLAFDSGPHRGIAFAKNRALSRRGNATFAGILDSDDYYHPTFISRCVAELEAHPEVVAVYTDNLRVLDDDDETTLTEPAADWSIEALLRCQLRGDCYLARWSALERTQLHDERFELEVDYDLYYQLANLGPLRRIPEPLTTVTEHAGRTTRDRSKAAYWHAAGLGKYGFPISWARQRASGHPEWTDAIEQGYMQGRRWRDEAGCGTR